MPIPFLVAGAVGVFSVAARGVNRDMKEEINQIYGEIESVVDDANEKAEKEMQLFHKSLEINDNKKSDIIEYIIAPFIEELNKIKNSELRDRIDAGEVQKILSINSKDYEIKKYDSTTGQKIVSSIKDIYAISAGIAGVGVSYMEYKKLSSQKTIAEGKLEQVKLQSEELNSQVSALKEMRKQTDEITGVLTSLEKPLRTAFFAFLNIIKKSGYEYLNYSKEEQKALMLIVDAFSAVNSIIINPVINQDGSFNHDLINNSLSVVELVESNEDMLKSM